MTTRFSTDVLMYKILTKFLEMPDMKAILDKQDEDGNTALHYAAAEGKKDQVKSLIVAGASLELANTEGATALALAEAAKHEEVIGFLKDPASAAAAAEAEAES